MQGVRGVALKDTRKEKDERVAGGVTKNEGEFCKVNWMMISTSIMLQLQSVPLLVAYNHTSIDLSYGLIISTHFVLIFYSYLHIGDDIFVDVEPRYDLDDIM